MKFPGLIFLVALTLVSCNSKQNKTEREDEPAIYDVDANDNEMNKAIQTAVSTIDQFKTALQSENPNYSYFALKTRFETEDGGEHIWISNIVLRDDSFYGIVDNLPESTTEVSVGDTIQIVNSNISDWMYVDGQKLRGGYTIRLLRQRMTDAERNQFDQENGLIIED